MPKRITDPVADKLSPEELTERRRALLVAEEVMDEIERWAEHLVSEAAAAAQECPERARRLFWTLIYYQAAERTMMPRALPRGRVMSVRQRRAFRRRRLPLGRYRGRRVSEAPSGHLVWLANLPAEHDDFLRDLRRYLRAGAKGKDRQP